MQRVERYILTKNKCKKDYLTLVDLCHKTKNLYNYANYILRQCTTNKLENIKEFNDLIITKQKTIKSKKTGKIKTFTQNFISEYALSKRLSTLKQIDYTSIKAQVAQQTIALLFKNYKSFYKASIDFAKNPSKYKKHPQLPKYKDKNGLCVAIFTNQCATINKNGNLQLSKDIILKNVKTSLTKKNFQQVRIIPKLDQFIIEIVYNKQIGDYTQQAILKNKKNHSAAIDIGVDNLATITSDNEDSKPLIVNGRALKSINQQYNKLIAKINSEYSLHDIHTGKKLKILNSKRNQKINDFMHKASRRIVDWCILNNIGTLYIGHNNNWKQNCNLGKKTNQKFVQIPFNNFIQKVMYKCKDIGISVEIIKEAYTSKCSALDNESIEFHALYLGKRIKRGLFMSKAQKLLNADVNGSLNILRLGTKQKIKVSNKIFNPIKLKNVNEIYDVAYFNWQPIDRGYVQQPYSLNTIKDFNKLKQFN